MPTSLFNANQLVLIVQVQKVGHPFANSKLLTGRPIQIKIEATFRGWPYAWRAKV